MLDRASVSHLTGAGDLLHHGRLQARRWWLRPPHGEGCEAFTEAGHASAAGVPRHLGSRRTSLGHGPRSAPPSMRMGPRRCDVQRSGRDPSGSASVSNGAHERPIERTPPPHHVGRPHRPRFHCRWTGGGGGRRSVVEQLPVAGARRRRPCRRRRAAVGEATRHRLVRHERQARPARRHRLHPRRVRSGGRHHRPRPAVVRRARRCGVVRAGRGLCIADDASCRTVHRRRSQPGRCRRRRRRTDGAAPRRPRRPAADRVVGRPTGGRRRRDAHRSRRDDCRADAERSPPLPRRGGSDDARCHRRRSRGAVGQHAFDRCSVAAQPDPACCRSAPSGRARRHRGRRAGRRSVLHSERRLLPHRHGHHRAAGRRSHMDADHRWVGRSADDVALRGPARPGADRVGHHADLRVERGGRQPDGHGPLAGCAPRPTLGGGRRQRRRRPGGRSLRRRLHVRLPRRGARWSRCVDRRSA